jgi:hypothetical protein
MSAIGGKADITRTFRNVCFCSQVAWHSALSRREKANLPYQLGARMNQSQNLSQEEFRRRISDTEALRKTRTTSGFWEFLRHGIATLRQVWTGS